MTTRPYVIVSCTHSLDGYIDDTAVERLLLSGDEHFDYVDLVRATVDAIFVGANTVRRDNPRLLVRSEARRRARQASGRSENPLKVTLTQDGNLGPKAAFFTAGPAECLVYTSGKAQGRLQKQLGDAAQVIALGDHPTIDAVLADLYNKKVARLLVEGGSSILTQLLTAGLADELQLATASFFVGDTGAPRFVGEGRFRWNKDNRLKLQEVKVMGGVIAANYISPELEAADRRWMDKAFTQSRDCPPITGAYAVGAVLVGADNQVLATGYSWETEGRVHAEEAALAKVSDAALHGATMYSTLEPCSKRVSRPKSCAQLIIEQGGISRVVYAVPEPLFLQDCQGDEMLRAAGLTVRTMDAPEYGYTAQFCALNESALVTKKG